MNKKIKQISLTAVAAVAYQFVQAGYSPINTPTQELEFGGRLVLQYSDVDIDDDGERFSESDTDVRRFRPHVKYQYNDWRAKLAWELSDRDSNTVKDAYVEYRGFNNIRIKFGNDSVPFSRERMTSSADQQLPERALSGENNWGAPGRLPALHLEYNPQTSSRFFASFARANLYSDNYSEIRFVGPWDNTQLDQRALNEGWMAATRVDYSWGRPVDYQQSDFKQKYGTTISLAGFNWRADDDAPTLYDHYADAEGIELSVATRVSGLSVDIQLQQISADINARKLSQELKDFLGSDNPQVTTNILHNNTATLSHFTIDAGYMIIEDKLEVALSYQLLNSASEGKAASFSSGKTWEDSWVNQELGFSYFFDKHEHKIQASLRKDNNIQGQDESSLGLVLQWQYIY